MVELGLDTFGDVTSGDDGQPITQARLVVAFMALDVVAAAQ